jgi:hypothetical protein
VRAATTYNHKENRVALNDLATLVIGTGNFFTATEGTPMPDDLSAIPVGTWENIGHTSLEDIFAITSEGGDATVLGTLQAKQLRTTYSPRTESMTFTLQQFDEPGLRLYFGANSVTLPNGAIAPSQNPTPTIRAFLAVFIDGTNVFAFYAPKAEIYRADDMDLSDTESLAGLPLKVTPMIFQTNTWTYAVTPLTGVAVTKSAVKAGDVFASEQAITASDSANAAKLAGLGYVAANTAEWSAGQKITVGSYDFHWDGSAWAAGAAS